MCPVPGTVFPIIPCGLQHAQSSIKDFDQHELSSSSDGEPQVVCSRGRGRGRAQGRGHDRTKVLANESGIKKCASGRGRGKGRAK